MNTRLTYCSTDNSISFFYISQTVVDHSGNSQRPTNLKAFKSFSKLVSCKQNNLKNCFTKMLFFLMTKRKKTWTYPVLNAILTNPFRFLSVNVADPGYASNDSAAPPMTIMAALPFPFFVQMCVMLSFDTSFSPMPNKKSRWNGHLKLTRNTGILERASQKLWRQTRGVYSSKRLGIKILRSIYILARYISSYFLH